jgi:uridine phosphorylase
VALVANFGIGSPIAAVMLEDLVALGCREVISIGTTGALQPGMAIGDIVVCDRAIRDEGTSHHYLPSARYVAASGALTARVQAALDDAKVAYRTGTSWTVDAPYRETVGEARHYRDEGVTCVEMAPRCRRRRATHRVGLACRPRMGTGLPLRSDAHWTGDPVRDRAARPGLNSAAAPV